MKVELLGLNDFKLFCEHAIRNMQETAIHGGIAHPYPITQEWDLEKFMENRIKKFETSITDLGFERAFIIWDKTQIIGHTTVSGSHFLPSKHRLNLGMGIETAYRSKGYGRLLLQETLQWAKSHPQFKWVDLNVFSHNTAAISLYEKFGFVYDGEKKDLFIVDGQSIDDRSYSLKLE